MTLKQLLVLVVVAASLLAATAEVCDDATACNQGAADYCWHAPEHYKCDGSCVEDTNNNMVCDPLEVTDCKDKTACNYNPMADHADDSLCEFAQPEVICSGETFTCPEGYVADCSGSGTCCPTKWIGDGVADCGDREYGCDLRCHQLSMIVRVTDPRYDETNDDHVNFRQTILDEKTDCAEYKGPTRGCDGKELFSQPTFTKTIDNCGVCGGDSSCSCYDRVNGQCDVFVYLKDVTQKQATIAYKSTREFFGYQIQVTGITSIDTNVIQNSPLAPLDDAVACSGDTQVCVGFSWSGQPFPAGEGNLLTFKYGGVEEDSIHLGDPKIVSQDRYLVASSAPANYPVYVAQPSVTKATVGSFTVVLDMISHSNDERFNTDIADFSFKMNGVQVTSAKVGDVAVPCSLVSGVMYDCHWPQDGSVPPTGPKIEVDVVYTSGVGLSVELTEVVVVPTVEFNVPTTIVYPNDGSAYTAGLPQVQLHTGTVLAESVQVRYFSFVEITGFQFRVRGVSIQDATSAVEAFSVSSGVNTGLIIGFSMTGGKLATGSDMALLTVNFNQANHASGTNTMIMVDSIFTAINQAGEDDYVLVTDPRVAPGMIEIPDCDPNGDGWCDEVDYDGDGCVSREDKDPANPGGCPLCGDADGDSRVTVRDLVRIVSQIMTSGGILDTSQPDARFGYGDVNKDGRLTVLDIVWIVQAIVRYVNPTIEFPDCSLD